MVNRQNVPHKEALQWYLDHGVDEALDKEPRNKLKKEIMQAPQKVEVRETSALVQAMPAQLLINANAASKELAAKATNLAELEGAIRSFDGLAVKKTATNLVFADGNPKARVMLVGEAPGADEDRQGKPFVGVSGQLLDKILKCIDLERTAEEVEKSIYISNILNWRPPGNRTPTPAEMEMSQPFIEKHIALINPQILILCGSVAARTLLHTDTSISKLRRKFHDYMPQTIKGAKPIPAIATYHPAYLLRTPSQKRAVWQDMLMLQDRLRNI